MVLTKEELRRRISFAVNRKYDEAPSGLTPAAVLLAIVERGEDFSLVFTKRSMTVATHKGQISFPGGAMEEADATPADAATREAFEEVGILPQNVEVLGYLEGMRTVSDFFVVPVVGIVAGEPRYKPQQDEVDEVFEISLEVLSNTEIRTFERRVYKGLEYNDCQFLAAGRSIWGITGKILNSFLEQIFPEAPV